MSQSQASNRRAEPIARFPEQHYARPTSKDSILPPRFEAAAYRAGDQWAYKVALMTGGDPGTGQAVALMFAREGAAVSITFLLRAQHDALITQKTIGSQGGECYFLPGDITESASCASLVNPSVSKFGRLDILVLNAAHQACTEKLDELPDEDIELTFNPNVYALTRLCCAALNHMRPGASQRKSHPLTSSGRKTPTLAGSPARYPTAWAARLAAPKRTCNTTPSILEDTRWLVPD